MRALEEEELLKQLLHQQQLQLQQLHHEVYIELKAAYTRSLRPQTPRA
jgi:hypothetical protein